MIAFNSLMYCWHNSIVCAVVSISSQPGDWACFSAMRSRPDCSCSSRCASRACSCLAQARMFSMAAIFAPSLGEGTYPAPVAAVPATA
jgi:hypothetical protein